MGLLPPISLFYPATFLPAATSMGADRGLARQLPPAVPPDQQDISLVNRRNMLRVMVNSQGQILANGERSLSGGTTNQR